MKKMNEGMKALKKEAPDVAKKMGYMYGGMAKKKMGMMGGGMAKRWATLKAAWQCAVHLILLHVQ